MNQGLKPPCKGCERNQNGFCTGWKRCNAWRLWFGNEWKRVKLTFKGDGDDIRRNGAETSAAI